ncbi:MAG TPA: hypothetical protein GXX28_04545 [Firmicutes bacterium]|nr:hypothetical protein [Bacillota bacterium]
MPFVDRDGRLRILFADAYDSLARRGIISLEQAEAVKELIDRLEEWTPERLQARLQEVFPGTVEPGEAGEERSDGR